MKKHTRIYIDALGYDRDDPTEFRPCELTGNRSNDIHHIIGRGKCGEDRIENLMALTRKKHLDYGDKVVLIPTLLLAHRTFLIENNVSFDNEWFEKKLKEYKYRS